METSLAASVLSGGMNIALVVALALFGWIAITELVDVFCK